MPAVIIDDDVVPGISRVALRRRIGLAALAGAMAFVFIVSGSGARPTGGHALTGPSLPAIYWGAEIGTQYTGTAAPWDMGALTKFQSTVGKSPSIVAFNIPWSICQGTSCVPYEFPTKQMDELRQYGALPMLNWASVSSPFKKIQPAYRLENLIRGRFDSYLEAFAAEVREWGHPFFLRFDWEMNGNWFPWGAHVNRNLAHQYVLAWRHVHDIFAREGVTNATWVWCPYVMKDPSVSRYAALYPGNAYVDWTCLDGFNFGPRMEGPHGWRSFDTIYRGSYDAIANRVAPTKPMLLGEVASSQYGGHKPYWIRNMLQEIPRLEPKIRALVWFDVIDQRPAYRRLGMQLESSRASLRAFTSGIDHRAFLPNAFALSMTAPIRALSQSGPF